MPDVVTAPIRKLAGALADLRDRVRAALAGEMARVVSEAVREVVTSVLRSRPLSVDAPLRTSVPLNPHALEKEPDPWDEQEWQSSLQESHPGTEPAPSSVDMSNESSPRTFVAPAAMAVGVSAGRWWLRRRGSILEAVGVAAVVSIVTLAGGPVARAGAILVSAAADLVAASDALHTGAARLEQF